MAIKIKIDLDFGAVLYVKVDPQQREHILVGIAIDPPNQVKFYLSYMGDITEYYDFECSTEVDKLKKIENADKDDD